MKRILILFSIIGALSLHAQSKYYTKAEKAYLGNNLKAANKYADKCLEDREIKDNPNVLLLKSKIMFAISKDPKLWLKYSSAMKEAMKYAEKSLLANPNQAAIESFKNKHIAYFTLLLNQNNKEAIENYKSNKYAKALPMFKKSMLFGLDTQSLVLAADCYWQLAQYTESVELYKKAAEMIYMAVLDSNSQVYPYHRDPFRKLGQYFIEANAFDSAYIFVKNGREILPNDPLLNQYTYKLMRYTLDRIPPSGDYLRAVQNGLKDFPEDSFLNHRENSIYIYLLNGMALANTQNQFDSLLQIYASSKAAKAGLKKINTIKQFDIFAGLKKREFIPRLKYYFKDIGLTEACYATWLSELSLDSVEANESARLKALLEKESNIPTAAILFERHLELNPKSQVFLKGRSQFVLEKNKAALTYYDLLPLIRLNVACHQLTPKTGEFNTRAKSFRLRLISESADSGDFQLSRKIWVDAKGSHADQFKALESLWRKIVELDFKYNYFGSRVNSAGKQEAGVYTYTWNGNVDSCLSGNMSMGLILQLEKRINYFRRMAGLTEEIVLSNQDNEYCMYAAMMCEANKSMSHEPSDGWRCFIPAGLEALKNSILSKDGNPSIAITAAMGQNHPSVGNRRWLLYPHALYMGIGCSKTYTAIKAVDHSRELDSNKYKNQYIAWPPAGDCPKMLTFKKWSFSLDLDLSGATVKMKNSKGEAIELKQENLSLGYGINTLVWEPQMDSNLAEKEPEYTVSIHLKDGKTYTYKVKLIDIILP